jgi:hypothetical protein
VIKPYIAYSTIGKNITLNLTSPVVGLLESLFAKGDLVLVNVSRSEALVAELLLSYATAKGTNVTFYGLNGERFYLVPMLEMPINSNYTLIGTTAIRTPYGVAVLVGPVSLEGLPNLIKNWLAPIEAAKGEIKLPITNQNLSYQNWDPCYAIYWNSNWQGSSGVYTSGNFIFLWGMNALESQGAGISPALGVDAVEDNYGDTFYYDSCIIMANSLTSIRPAFIDAELLGDVAYRYTYSGEFYLGLGQLHYLIGGFDMYKSYEATINYPSFYNAYVADSYGSYVPTPTGSAVSYSISSPPDVSVNYTMPSSWLGGVNIRVSTTPYYVNEAKDIAYNLTWTFDYTEVTGTNAMPNNGAVINGFSGGAAAIWLANYSPGNTYWFYLPFNAEVKTLCWSAWANTAWVVGFVPSSSNAISISTAYFGYSPFQQPSNAPSGSWISGYYIYPYQLTPSQGCNDISLSGPS